eukprot:TRINITY_DN9275_c0_g1_i2.p1 TRINITY_DN9275_c0_g1~~TRINITY_DN9275_c0_g1_i2.p1  ORF type:complete len:763 (-),score=77.82 TRINITY_DN9275_c0_g1_i2:211-2499(-)
MNTHRSQKHGFLCRQPSTMLINQLQLPKVENSSSASGSDSESFVEIGIDSPASRATSSHHESCYDEDEEFSVSYNTFLVIDPKFSGKDTRCPKRLTRVVTSAAKQCVASTRDRKFSPRPIAMERHKLLWDSPESILETVQQALSKSVSWFWVYSFLLCLGVILATLSFLIDVVVTHMQQAHRYLMMTGDGFMDRWIIWFIWMFAWTIFASFITQRYGRLAIGSGIPQVKSIFGGEKVKHLFGKGTMVTKVVGMTAILGSGIIAGKMGPFIHLSCIISHQLLKLSFFKGIYGTPGFKANMYAAGAAAGIASHFGATIGGILFTIEVASTYYPTRTYWFASVAACLGGLLNRVFRSYWQSYPDFSIPHVQIPDILSAGSHNLAGVLIVGIICGFVGPLFTWSCAKVVQLRKYLQQRFPNITVEVHVWIYVCSATLVISILTFKGVHESLWISPFQAVLQLVSPDPLPAYWGGGATIYATLMMFVCVRFVAQILGLSFPVPCGLYVPLLVIGAGIGRMVGEILLLIFGSENILPPGIFAIIGAGALPGAATQVASSALIAVEITGANAILILVFVATLISNLISRALYIGVYDKMMELLALPYIPDLTFSQFRLKAKHIMMPNPPVLYTQSSLVDVLDVLLQHKPMAEEHDRRGTYEIPLVISRQNPKFLGGIHYQSLNTFALDWSKALSERTIPNSDDLTEVPIDISKVLTKKIHVSNITFQENTEIGFIHGAFIQWRVPNAFVLRDELLVGMITRKGLKTAIA